MLKKLLELFRAQVFLARDVQENKEKLSRLREQVDELSDLVIRLQFEIQSVRQEERHEREKLALRMENALLRIERLLPPSGDGKKRK